MFPHPPGPFGEEGEGENAQQRQRPLQTGRQGVKTALKRRLKGDMVFRKPGAAGVSQLILPICQEILARNRAGVVLTRQQGDGQRMPAGGLPYLAGKIGVAAPGLRVTAGFGAVLEEQRHPGRLIQPAQGRLRRVQAFAAQPGRILTAGEQQRGAAVRQVAHQAVNGFGLGGGGRLRTGPGRGLGLPCLQGLLDAFIVVKNPQPVPLAGKLQHGGALLGGGPPRQLLGGVCAHQRAQQGGAKIGKVHPAGERVGLRPLRPAPGKALGEAGRQGGLAHAAASGDGDHLVAAGVQMGQFVQLAVAPQQRARRLDIAAQVHLPRFAQFGNVRPSGVQRQGGVPASARHVTHRQPHAGGVLGQGQARLAQGFAKGQAGQQAVVQRHGQVIAERVGVRILHAHRHGDAVQGQGARQVGLRADRGHAGAKQRHTQHAARGHVEQVAAGQRVGAAVVFFEQKDGQRANGGVFHIPMASQVQQHRAAAQSLVERLAGGRNAARFQAFAAVLQHGADGF